MISAAKLQPVCPKGICFTPQTDAYYKGKSAGQREQFEQMLDVIADFCKAQNSQFNRERWMSYIAGECGPNGGRK